MQSAISQIMNFIHTVSGLSLDIIVLAIVFVVFGSIGFYFGRSKLIAFVLAFYPATLLYSNFPYLEKFTFWRADANQVALSHALVFLIFFIISWIVIHAVYHEDFGLGGGERMFQVGILALMCVVVFLAFMHIVVPLQGVYAFSPSIAGLFGAGTFFWWLLVPLVGVYLGAR
jgi:hypothetical protein